MNAYEFLEGVMARKPITEQTQTNVFLNCRRRCCLCFWLKGEDEVKKGQIAHLDGDNENSSEGNLVFLCLEHHDEYDSSPRLSKGLRLAEVKRWRDELHKEMQYRFRSIRTKSAEISLVGFVWPDTKPEFFGRFVIKNTGEVELRHAVIAIRLADGISGTLPKREQAIGGPFGETHFFTNIPTPWAAYESAQDLFEPKGRVCVKEFPPLDLFMPGHSTTFDALRFQCPPIMGGDNLELDYRIDAEETPTIRSKLRLSIPTDPEDFLFDAE